VIAVEPKHGTTDEEGLDLIPAVTEDVAVPVWMNSLAWIRVLEQTGSIKVPEPVLVVRKVRREPNRE
jgi:hypothetical protein